MVYMDILSISSGHGSCFRGLGCFAAVFALTKVKFSNRALQLYTIKTEQVDVDSNPAYYMGLRRSY
jgi:hypothetical protein